MTRVWRTEKHEWRRVGKERKKSVWKAKRHGPKPGSRRGTYYYCPCCDKPFTSLGDVVQHLKDDGCLVGR
jgi:hypothetical protein